jgi:hypothetical protein
VFSRSTGCLEAALFNKPAFFAIKYPPIPNNPTVATGAST